MQNNLTYNSLTESYLKADAIDVMALHGKSFYFASMIFSKSNLLKVATLYRLCRFIDDCADELPEQESKRAIESIIFDLNHPENPSKFNQLVQEVESWGVERSYIRELVLGAEFDAQGGKVETYQDLMLYCYQVAGVVGLMMCPLIGVKDMQGYPHAIDLGLGMQLTNICRDVLEDAQRQRIYLPENELQKLGLGLGDLQKTVTPLELKTFVKSVLDQADEYYESAYNGLSYIPIRPRLVILLAGEIYRSIGVKIRNNDYQVLRGRISLSLFEKFVVAVKTMRKLLASLFWKPKPHSSVLHKHLAHLPGANL